MASSTGARPRRTATTLREAEGPRWGAQIRRGELYRIKHPGGDPKRSRVVVVVSRGAHLASRFSTAIALDVE